MIANVNRGKRRRPFTLDDFMLKFGNATRREQTVAEQRQAVEAWAKVLKAKDLRKNGNPGNTDR